MSVDFLCYYSYSFFLFILALLYGNIFFHLTKHPLYFLFSFFMTTLFPFSIFHNDRCFFTFFFIFQTNFLFCFFVFQDFSYQCLLFSLHLIILPCFSCPVFDSVDVENCSAFIQRPTRWKGFSNLVYSVTLHLISICYRASIV